MADSPSGSANCPLLSSITFMHWLSESSIHVTLGNHYCHRGGQRFVDFPFPITYLVSSHKLAHWNSSQTQEPLDESSSGLSDH